MTDHEEFEKWWLTKFSAEFLDSDNCWSAWTGWQARGELDAVRIKELEMANKILIGMTDNMAKQIAELTAKLDKARDGDCCTEGCIKCDARKVLAETQKPVAWKDKIYGNLHHVDYGDSIPLYTTPPSREWQSLSDVEIDKIYCEVSDNCVKYFPSELYAAWFKALKEKNNG